LDLAREGQFTEGFTRAIDQLGSDKLDVRIGGIYALERISRDSERDRGRITEVLTAFVREHPNKKFVEKSPKPQADIEAVLSVLKHRTSDDYLDLGEADLRGADLEQVQLKGANLQGALLNDAHLKGAKLEGAKLFGAHVQGADLRSTGLTEQQLIIAFCDERTRLDSSLSCRPK